MQSKDLFFHTELPEDAKFTQYREQGKLDRKGIVQPLSTQISPQLLLLDPHSLQAVDAVFTQTILVNGREGAFAPGISVSIEEIGKKCEVIANSLGHTLKLTLKGDRVVHAVESIVRRIFAAWCYDLEGFEPLTDSFKILLQISLNDSAWEFSSEKGMSKEEIEFLMDEALYGPLGEKVRDLQLNPHAQLVKLDILRKNSSKIPYVHQIFTKYPHINDRTALLCKIYAQAFAFWRAVDVEADNACLSIRTLSDGKNGHDCVFTVRTRTITTYRDGLFIDMSEHVSDRKRPLVLESSLGKSIECIVQTLSDYNLLLMVYDKSQSIDAVDFARTISHITFGGRFHQKSWIPAIIKELEKEATRLKIPLSELLAQQLISRAKNHHKNEPAILTALAFNASALLYWRHEDYRTCIQKFWRLIYDEFDRMENYKDEAFTHPIIEKIHNLMRDPELSFIELYTYFQIASHLCQNQTAPSEYYPTQTAGALFTQCRMKLTKSGIGNEEVFFTLLFPFDLSKALALVAKRTKIFEGRTKSRISLQHAYSELIFSKESSFAFGQSRLRSYSTDPRREFHAAVNLARWLLKTHSKMLWSIGFSSLLALIAQKKDPQLIQKMMQSFIEMLKERWMSSEGKNDTLQLLCRTLEKSELPLNPKFFAAFIGELDPKKNVLNSFHLIQEIVRCKYLSLIGVLDEHLNVLEHHLDLLDKGLGDLTVFYWSILKLFSLDVIGKEAVEPFRLTNLQQICTRIRAQEALPIEVKLRWFLGLYDKLKDKSYFKESPFEESLFEFIYQLLGSLTTASEDFQQAFNAKIMELLVEILQSGNRSTEPFKALRFVQSFSHLQLLDEENRQSLWKSAQTVFVKLQNAQHYLEELFLVNQEIAGPSRVVKIFKSLQKQMVVFNDDNPQALAIELYMTLLEQWVASEDNFAESAEFICQAASVSFPKMSPSQMQEFCRIVFKFYDKYYNTHPEGSYHLIKRIFNIVQAPRSKSLLLKRIYQHLTYSEIAQSYENSEYNECVEAIVELEKLNVSLICSLSPFLKRLSQRGMDQEVFYLFLFMSQEALQGDLDNLKIFVKAIEAIQNISSLPWNQVGIILNKLPNPPAHFSDLQLSCSKIYAKVSDWEVDNCNYVEAKKWLRNELNFRLSKDASFYHRGFKLVESLIQVKEFAEAFSLVMSFDYSSIFLMDWLNVCNLFVTQGKLGKCSQIFEHKEIMGGLDTPACTDTWKELAANLLKKLRIAVRQPYIHAARKYDALFHVVHQVMWFWKPEADWKCYFSLISEYASLTLAEEALQRLTYIPKEEEKKVLPSKRRPIRRKIKVEVSDYSPNDFVVRFNHLDKRKYWFCLVDRLCRENSPLVVDMDAVWTPLTEYGSHIYGEDAFSLLSDMFERILTACEKILNKQRIRGANEVFLKGICELVQGLRIYPPNFLILFGLLFQYSFDEKVLRYGIYSVLDVLMSNRSSLAQKKIAIKLINSYVVLVNPEEEQLKAAILGAVKMALVSDCCNGIDSLKVLRGLNTYRDKIYKIDITSLTIFQAPLEYCLKVQAIENLMTESLSTLHRISPEDRDMIGRMITRTMNIVFDYRLLFEISKNMKKMKYLVDGKTLCTLKNFFKAKDFHWRPPSLLERFLIQWSRDTYTINTFFGRLRVMYQYGRALEFYATMSERRAFRSRGVVLLPVLMVIAFVVFKVVSAIFEMRERRA